MCSSKNYCKMNIPPPRKRTWLVHQRSPSYALSVATSSKVTTILIPTTIDLFFLLLNLCPWNHRVFTHVSWFLKAHILFVRFIYTIAPLSCVSVVHLHSMEFAYIQTCMNIAWTHCNLSLLSCWVFGIIKTSTTLNIFVHVFWCVHTCLCWEIPKNGVAES